MVSITSLQQQFGQDTLISYPDWEVARGQHAMILGNSGSGKTTLLHLLAALLRPTEGQVVIDGVEMTGLSQGTLDAYRGQHIGIVFQNPHLIRSLTVRENLLLAQSLGKHKISRQKADKVMDQLGISELKARKIHEISQGQAQRVSIARALMNDPKLLLADEPTASLDDVNCQKVITLLKEQAERTEATLVIATHDQRVKNEFENRLEL